MTTNVYFWYAFLKLRQQDIFDIQTGSAQPHIYPKHIAELSIGNIDRFQIALLFSHPAEPLYLFMLGKALDLVITEKIIFLFVEFSTNIKVSLSFRQ